MFVVFWQENFSALENEFSNEVQLLSKLEHRSLVKLLGCIENKNERIVITEYVSNGTLREHLDGMFFYIFDIGRTSGALYSANVICIKLILSIIRSILRCTC